MDNAFKKGPSKIYGRQPLKNLSCLSKPYHFKCFKGYLPQILFGTFLNTLSQLRREDVAFPQNCVNLIHSCRQVSSYCNFSCNCQKCSENNFKKYSEIYQQHMYSGVPC